MRTQPKRLGGNGDSIVRSILAHMFSTKASPLSPKNPNGIGAKCTTIKRFTNPAKVTKDKRTNGVRNDKLSELLVVE